MAMYYVCFMEKEVKNIPASENYRKWMLILPWSFWLSFTILLVIFLRAQTHSTDFSFSFYLPHLFIAFAWGIVASLPLEKYERTSFIRSPFISLLFTTAILWLILCLDAYIKTNKWHDGFIPVVSLMEAVVFVVIPFFIGYAPIFFVRYIKKKFCTV